MKKWDSVHIFLNGGMDIKAVTRINYLPGPSNEDEWPLLQIAASDQLRWAKAWTNSQNHHQRLSLRGTPLTLGCKGQRSNNAWWVCQVAEDLDHLWTDVTHQQLSKEPENLNKWSLYWVWITPGLFWKDSAYWPRGVIHKSSHAMRGKGVRHFVTKRH